MTKTTATAASCGHDTQRGVDMSSLELFLLEVKPKYRPGRGRYSRRKHRGYTNDLRDAGRFVKETAERYAAEAPEKYRIVPAPTTP